MISGCKISLLLAAAILFQTCLVTQPVSAQIYEWKDATGNIFYGDSPPPGVKPSVKHATVNRIVRPESKESHQEERQISGESQLRDISDISVILYATDWCPYCKKTREYLNSEGIRFTEYNIDKDRSKREEMKEKSGSDGVPVLDIERIIIRGFNPQRISAAIEDRRRANN
jgi:glutaredoxin-like YruB-family protein